MSATTRLVRVDSEHVPAQSPELLSIGQAAAWLGVSRSTLYRAIANGTLPVTPIRLGTTLHLARRQLDVGWTGEPSRKTTGCLRVMSRAAAARS